MKIPALFACTLVATAGFAQAPPPLVAPGIQLAPTPIPTPVLQARLNLVISIQKTVSEVKTTLANEDSPIMSDPQAYTVTIKNNGPTDLKGASIEYRFFLSGATRGETGSEPEMKRKEGSADPGTLRIGESFTFTTDTFDVPRSVPRGGFFYYADGSRTRFKADLGGIWIRVMRGGNILFEKAEPSSVTSRDPF